MQNSFPSPLLSTPLLSRTFFPAWLPGCLPLRTDNNKPPMVFRDVISFVPCEIPSCVALRSVDTDTFEFKNSEQGRMEDGARSRDRLSFNIHNNIIKRVFFTRFSFVSSLPPPPSTPPLSCSIVFFSFLATLSFKLEIFCLIFAQRDIIWLKAARPIETPRLRALIFPKFFKYPFAYNTYK